LIQEPMPYRVESLEVNTEVWVRNCAAWSGLADGPGNVCRKLEHARQTGRCRLRTAHCLL